MTASQITAFSLPAMAMAIVARIAFMLLFRVRVLGRQVAHDYSRELRNRDEDFRLLDWYRWGDYRYPPPPRSVTLRVQYSYNGIEYLPDVRTTVARGREPDRLVLLWIDPKNPNNVTMTGPGYWFFGLLALSIIFAGWKAGMTPVLDGNFPFCARAECMHSANELKPLPPVEWHQAK